MAKIGAVILAAGESSRLGRPKQLVQFQGKSLLRRIIDAAIQAGCAPVAIVTGRDHAKVSTEIDDAVLIENEHWELGIGTSIRAGVAALTNDKGTLLDAIVLLVCDQPFVDSNVIRSLIERHTQTGKPIAASSYAGTVGVPALFDRICFAELLALPDDSGAKPIFQAEPGRVAKFEFPEGMRDIDTIADYENLSQ